MVLIQGAEILKKEKYNDEKISIAIAVVIALVLGAVGGYFYNNKSSESSVLTDGEYSVTASWNWKSLMLMEISIHLMTQENMKY